MFLSAPLSPNNRHLAYSLVWRYGAVLGKKLPAHSCSLAWIRAGRAAITPQGKQNRTKQMSLMYIITFSEYITQD